MKLQMMSLRNGADPLVWFALSAFALGTDYATGPYVQFTILQVVPVTLATLAGGFGPGITLAVGLPMLRFWLYLQWTMSTMALSVVDAVVDVAVLAALVCLLRWVAIQQREIRILEGMLPICSFCKRIRNHLGAWEAFERYISVRSNAAFSHTICPECGRLHYPGLVDETDG